MTIQTRIFVIFLSLIVFFWILVAYHSANQNQFESLASASQPHFEPLVPVKQKTLIVGRRASQRVETGNFAGRSAAKLVWHPGAKPLLEAVLPNRPMLSAFSSGVDLSIAINGDGFPGLSVCGVRVIDANDEIFQFGRLKLPKGPGWKDWRVDLRSRKATDHWGGRDTGRNQIDPPVRLLSLLFKAPEGKISEPRYLLISDIKRNPFDPKDVSPVVQLRPVAVDLKTELQSYIVKVGEENKATFVVANPKDHKPVVFDFFINFETFGDSPTALHKKNIRLNPGESVEVPIGKHLQRTGWYRALPELRVPGTTAIAATKPIAFAYMTPAGKRQQHSPNDFLFGIDARIRNPKDQEWIARACALIGADYIRSGRVWTSIQPEAGDQFDWENHVGILNMLQKHGLATQYGLCFTPTWAARDSYREEAWKPLRPILEEARRKKQRGKMGAVYKKLSAALSRTPPRLDAWQNFIRAVVEKNKTRGVFAYEIWNEPDLYGFYKGTTEEYLELQKAAYKQIKAGDPKAQVLSGGFATLLGHHGHHANPKLIERAILETQDHYDAICIHQHGRFPTFQQALDGPLAKLRSKLNKDKPLFFTESGVPVGRDYTRMDQAAAVVKRIAFARARGAIAYSWFVLHARNRHMDSYSMLDANQNNQPRPAYCTFNELVRMLRGKQFKEQANAGPGNWLLEFSGKNDSTLIGWDENAPSPGQVVLVQVPKSATAEVVDMMGNAVSQQQQNGIIAWKLSRRPAYLNVRGGTAKVLGPLVSFPSEPYAKPNVPVNVPVTLRNPLPKPAVFKLVLEKPDGTKSSQDVQVRADSVKNHPLQITIPKVSPGGKTPKVRLHYELVSSPWSGELRLELHTTRSLPAKMEGRSEPDFICETKKHIYNANENDPTREKYTWKGIPDLSARVTLGLDKEHLLVKVAVQDDKHLQPHKPAQMWKGDSVQVALAIPDTNGSWELGFAQSDSGEVINHCWRAPVGFSREYAKTIRVTTKQTKGGITYLARLPFDGFGVTPKLLRTKAIRVNLLVNDDDGGGREGFCFIAPGFGFGKTQPEMWPQISFE